MSGWRAKQLQMADVDALNARRARKTACAVILNWKRRVAYIHSIEGMSPTTDRRGPVLSAWHEVVREQRQIESDFKNQVGTRSLTAHMNAWIAINKTEMLSRSAVE